MKGTKTKKFLFLMFSLILSVFMLTFTVTSSVKTLSFVYAAPPLEDEINEIGDIGINNNNDHGDNNIQIVNNEENQNANANEAANNIQNQPEAADGKTRWQKADAATRRAAIESGIKAASELNDLIIDMVKNKGATDYPKFLISIAKNTAAMAATIYFGNPAAGTAVTTGVDSILKWFHLGESSQTELQMMESRLNDRFDEVLDRIDTVKDDIQKLSAQISEEIDTVLNKIDESFEAYYAKTQVTDFIYSTSGNFSYNMLRDYLYSTTNYSLYYNVVDAIINKKSDAEIETQYNNLYYALMHYDLASGVKSNIDRFTEYYIASSTRQSICHYYYEYLSSNQSYIDSNASVLAADFAAQVYYDYAYTLNVIRMINAYQISQIYLNNSELSVEEIREAKYYYGTGENDFVTINYLENILSVDLENKAKDAYNQMLKDVEDVLGLSDSFFVEEADGRQRYVTENKLGTFGNVIEGETVYLNQVIAQFCNRFALDATLFKYEFKQGETLLVDDKSLGYYKVNTTEPFTGSVYYDGTLVYSIPFKVNNNENYLGGKGTKTDPFVIASVAQYKLMLRENKSDYCYLLIKDIDFKKEAVSSVASTREPYMGVFDGGGHKLINIKVSYGSENQTSIFGAIGGSGVVKYLEVDGADISESGENNAKSLSVGIIAAVNNGTIYSTFVTDSSVSASRDSNEKHSNLNKAIYMYVGGIAGENNGNISNCKVENTSVKGNSVRFYQTDKDSYNQNSVYVGGIVGSNHGQIQNCYVSSNVKPSASAKSEMNEGLSFRYPYINVYAGGVAGLASSLKTIKNVYSSVASENLTTSYDYKNRNWSGGSFGNHCESKKHTYIPNKSEADLNAIKGTNADAYKIANVARTIKFSFSTEKDAELDCSKDLVYVGTDKSFRLENLKLSLVMDKNGEEIEEKSCLSVIGVYGFDSYNPDKQNNVVRNVMLKIYDSLNNSVYTLKTGYYVKKNSIYKLSLPSETTYKFELGSTITGDVFDDLKINTVNAHYHDGTIENVASGAVFSLDTTDSVGAAVGRVTYNNLSCDVECFVECTDPLVDGKVVVTKYILSANKLTCTVIGYRTRVCERCGKTEIEDFIRVFNTVIANAKATSCSEPGYTGDICIAADGEVFAEQVVIERGKSIAIIDHNFDYSSVNVDNYRDEHYHYCVDCHHQEPHMFRTIENNNELILECVTCGYTTKIESVSREQIEKLPRVVVSNSYAISSSREIKVFIDLHASTGITAANFSVNYDPALSLVSYELGNILNSSDTIDAFKVYEDHINVTLAQKGTDYSTDGTILILVFKLPNNAVNTNKFKVEVTNKDQKDKFTDKNGNKTDFVAYSGGIIMVSHLPGDVNGDEIVDLVDAVIISNYVVLDYNDQLEFVRNMSSRNPNFNIFYGDVNLDGSIDISDIVQLLRYTTGGYETTFVSNIFEVELNLDDGTTNQQSILVRYDGGESKFGDMQPLPELTKPGYKFVGWFTGFGGTGKQITNDTKVFYNKDQYKQTLYAHFIPNTITFNANGGTGSKPSLNYLSAIDLSNSYNEYISYITKEAQVYFDTNGIGTNSVSLLTYTFLGWATDPNGPVIYYENDTSIDLAKSGYDGVGNLVLYAVWSEEYVDPYKAEVVGYTFLGWTGVNKNEVIWDGETPLKVDSNITLYAKWRKNSFSFTYNSGTGDSHTELIVRDINNYDSKLWKNEYVRTGYHFRGWSLVEMAVVVDFNDEHVLTEENLEYVMNFIDNYGKVNLYAVWEGYTYYIEFSGNSTEVSGTMDGITVKYGEEFRLPAHTFTSIPAHKHLAGWSVYGGENNSVKYADQAFVSNITTVENETIMLYAVWEYDTYRVNYVMSGYLLASDVVPYNSSYTMRTKFSQYGENYEAARYVNEDFNEVGKTFEHWTTERTLSIEVQLIYYNTDNRFDLVVNSSGKGVITGYNGPTNGVLLIPSYIQQTREDSVFYEVETIETKAFASEGRATRLHFDALVIATSVRNIQSYAFYETEIEKIYIPNSVRNIYGYAFGSMYFIQVLVLPTNFNLLATNAFTWTTVEKVYYMGTEEQFRENIGTHISYNTIYFRRDSQPITVGENYWHYVNGEIVEWPSL
ncbi:MAG: InlB B-repeat-containing protein [Clostridia bacterium]|nr:InlB B-repeat-containing protein [Clostridia bacterium]